MGKVFAFHGGVHPPENKHQSTGLPIQPGPIPHKVRLPVQQHIGAPANVVVEVGQRVLKGQLIAEPAARMSAAIHASVSGTVTAIGPMPVAHSSGMDAFCIEIENDRRDEWVPHAGLADYHRLNAHDVADFIRGKGITGMGGAGFPTDIKLQVSDHHIVNTLVINAAECEPYITADDMLMRERADQVVSGIEVICHMLKPSHVMIGIEDNKPQAIQALQQAVRGNRHNIDVVVVPTKYPSGGEKQLIKLLTGIEVPSGGIPADVGIVCQNVGTTVAIHRAVHHGEPLVSRIVTMTGDAVARPHNMDVAIGTPFVDLLDAANLKENHLARLVVGGPMMGFSVNDDELPITKTTNCLIAATWDEMPEGNPAQPCIRCGACEQACPVELLPQQLHWFAKGREFEKAKNHNLFDCIECGACSYVCPSEIPLVQYYRFAKAEIRQEEAEARKAEHAKMRYEARIARQEAEQAEKEARRKQRAEDAAKAQAAKKDKDLAAAAATPAAAPATTDIKVLKTAAAVARTKLKKAEKAVATAREKGDANLAELEAALQTAQQKTDAAQQALAEAESGGAAAPATAAAPVADLKQLKTNAAVARTKLKQAEKALKNAEDKGLEGVEKLRETLAQLQAKADAAQQAYDAAQSTPAAAPTVDIKQLKTNAAVARTKLKQAEKALAKAQQSGEGDLAALEAKVAEQQAKTDAAQTAYEAAESGTAAPETAAPVAASAVVSAEQRAELQAEVNALQAKVDKGQAALDAAIAKGLPTADKMKPGVEKLRAKLAEAEQALAAAEGAGQNAAPAVSEAQLAELKADVEALQAKVDKGQAALDAAIAKGLPTADKMKPGVEKLRAKLAEATQALAAAEGAGQNAAPAVSEAQLAELKADVEALQTKVDKGQAALDAAIAKGLPTADKMKPGVEKLRAKLAEAKQALAAAEGAGQNAAPAVSEAQLAELKADVEALQAKVDKGQAALDAAIAKGLPTADKMKPGVEKLRAKLDAAIADYQAAGGSVAVPEPVAEPEPEPELDMKALKQQVSIMRTKLRKVEKALEDADSAGEDTTALAAERQQLEQRYDDARATFEAAEAQQRDAAAAQGIDLKQLKIDAAMARAAVTKAERALANVTEPDDQQESLVQALDAARHKAEQLNATLSRFE